ncbi:MAG: hypothetical protein IJ762_09615 [Bacteroidaceae bacterium]|nr:hypothetical protein [Bacteroidaceae bacterium]MBR1789426.1 hypothetical protein [Bacteroidaceae bacterium]
MAERVKGMVQCINCKNGTYMQWFKNPIICKCNIFNEKFVAEAKHICEEFAKRPSEKVEVTHYDHY